MYRWFKAIFLSSLLFFYSDGDVFRYHKSEFFGCVRYIIGPDTSVK